MTGWLEDLRYAWRMLRKQPGATAAAVAALAVGIGFNTAIYSMADAILYRPLPAPGLDRAVILFGNEAGRPEGRRSVSPADYGEWLTSLQSAQHVAAARQWSANLTGAGDPLAVTAWSVTPSFFDVMALEAAAGRRFTAREGEPGAPRSVILSHDFWAGRFGLDPNAIGSEIQIDGAAHTIIGVMPKGFRYPQGAEIWTPLVFSNEELAAHGSFYIRGLAALKPGAAIDQLNSELAAFSRRMAATYPSSHKGLQYGADWLRTNVTSKLTSVYVTMMLASVAFLLLIACFNVANLQLARALARGRELAIRAALGASRWRLTRQALTEGLLLACFGAMFGLLVAQWALDLMRAGMPAEVERFLPGWQRLGLNGTVLAYTLLTTAAAGVLAGIGPALWINRRRTSSQLQAAGRGATSDRLRSATRNLIVVVQVALTVVLLAGAALMAKGFRSIASVDVQADPASVLCLSVTQPDFLYDSPAKVLAFQQAFVDRLESLPGVAAAGIVTNIPYSESANNTIVQFRGRPEEPGMANLTQVQAASSGYFRALGIPIVRGRAFTRADGSDAPPVAIVSEAFVRRFFADGEDPLGRQFNAYGGEWITIIGVSADVLHSFLDRAPRPAVYHPSSQLPRPFFNAAVRTDGDPTALVGAIRAVVRELDPVQPVPEMKTFAKVISDALTGMTYLASTMGVFAVVAFLLALIGVYGLTAYAAGERTREFGIRLALGAERSGVLWLVLRRGMLLTGLGLALGWPASVLLASRIRNLFYGVNPLDPFILAGVPGVLLAAALLACATPAWRASRIDPIRALYHE